MIKILLDGEYKEAELFHVRMCFSKEMDELGRLTLSKMIHLLRVVMEIFYFRIFHNARVLYYPPSNPDMVPMLRDLIILCSTRWMFQKTIFHFHAAGIGEVYTSLPWFLKFLYRWGYFKPDVAIRLSEYNPDDGALLKARNQCLIPNGIVDEYQSADNRVREKRAICSLLFVGLIRETKGILVLVDAMRILVDKGLLVRAKIVGKFESPEFEILVMARIEELGLSERFDFTGVLVGTEKHQAYLDADIFCFPTFFESFGLVVAEAMQFELPVVVSRGQGVQSLVVDGVTGYLTDVNDSKTTANRIERLVLDSELRCQMGREGRQRYLNEYSIEKFHDRMNHCFSLVSRGGS